MSGLYLHIPFCRRKCPYCDFFSLVAPDAEVAGYTELLVKHLEIAAGSGWPGPFDTVYFGGGTPSLLSPEAVAQILRAADEQFGLTADVEITLEANPGTVTRQSLLAYRAAGVNRLSLGLQSCDNRQLKRLGRLHDRESGFAVVDLARAAGFDNLSLDLMFALPGQSESELCEEIEAYLSLQPEHLSCYGLTAEAGTPFGREVATGLVTLPGEEFYARAFLTLHQCLTAAGYRHYEIANYARPGRECRHNLGYWQRQDCLGVGAGAHSFRGAGWGSRWAVADDLGGYRRALSERKEPAVCLETFDRAGALSETVYLALRTARGVADDDLQRIFGGTLAEAFPREVAASAAWLTRSDGRWHPTPEGWLLFDHLIQPFL